MFKSAIRSVINDDGESWDPFSLPEAYNSGFRHVIVLMRRMSFLYTLMHKSGPCDSLGLFSGTHWQKATANALRQCTSSIFDLVDLVESLERSSRPAIPLNHCTLDASSYPKICCMSKIVGRFLQFGK